MQSKKTLQHIAENYTTIFCDIWGVIHNGVHPFQNALHALRECKKQNRQIILISNAPRPAQEVKKQLQNLNIKNEIYDNVITSGDVMREHLKKNPKIKIFHLGPERDKPLINGLPNPKTTKIENANAVICTGLVNDRAEKPHHYQKLLKRMKQKNITLYCANPDKIVQRGNKSVYCAGAIAEEYQKINGPVFMTGKPYQKIYQYAIKMQKKQTHKKQILVIGDAIETDIKGAEMQNIDAILITNGIHHNVEKKELKRMIKQNTPNAKIIAIMEELKW